MRSDAARPMSVATAPAAQYKSDPLAWIRRTLEQHILSTGEARMLTSAAREIACMLTIALVRGSVAAWCTRQGMFG